MLQISHIDVWGFEHAIRGMRNPMNSWIKSDSYTPLSNDEDRTFVLGPNDLELMRRLYRGGTEHRKFMRQIMISMDINGPLYWWKEFDTYKIGTVANSCSTMHKLHSRDLILDDFSCEHLKPMALKMLEDTIAMINLYRRSYIQSHDKEEWWQMIQLLPSSFNQLRTITLNYEVAAAIVHQRSEHKQDEWREQLVEELIHELPYFAQIIRKE